MEELFAEIVRRCAAGEGVVLCTLVRARGSTPQAAGAKMLVLQSGKSLGTLGGGCVEAEVRRRSLEIAAGRQSELLSYKLDHDLGWDDGLICGGMIDVYTQVIEPEAGPTFAPLAEKLAAGDGGIFAFDYRTADGPQHYEERILPAPTLVIAGAGHVGQALAPLAADLGFRVTIIDDRPDFVTPERFPRARRRITGDIESELAGVASDDQTFIVIVTRGHKHDGQALAAVVQSPARYIGMIGSKRKIRTIFAELAAAGVPREALYRIHAPVGLEIGAVTVPEIAMSIAAELIAVRRGLENQPAIPMLLGKQRVDAWLDHASDGLPNA